MFNEKDYNQKMDKTFDVFTKELGSLRTGRANSNMLDLIKVDVYGQKNANKSNWKHNNTRSKNDKYSSLGSKQCFINRFSN